jgi:hypothetical protein
MAVSKGQAFKQIMNPKNVAPANRKRVGAILAKYGVKKAAGGQLPESLGKKIAVELKGAHALKSRVGSADHTVAVSGSTSRDIFKALTEKYEKPTALPEKPAVEEEARRRVVSFKRPKDVEAEKNAAASIKDIAKAREHRGERDSTRKAANEERQAKQAAAQAEKEAAMRTQLNVKMSQEGRRSEEQQKSGTALEQAHAGVKVEEKKQARVELAAPMTTNIPSLAHGSGRGITTTQVSTPKPEAMAPAAPAEEPKAETLAGPPPEEPGDASKAIDTPI